MPPKKGAALALTNGGKDDGPKIEEITEEGALAIVTVNTAKSKAAKAVEDTGDIFADLAMPVCEEGEAVPDSVAQAGFTLAEKPICDTEYTISGEEMQVLDVRLRKYQEMCFSKHADITHRSPNIKLSETPYGMRLKNMAGVDDVPCQFTPGFVSKIVPLSLNDHPELICKQEAFLAATDPGLRIDEERRPGFFPYKALRGTGIVFLKSVGTALFHKLKENECCIAKTPNVSAFQTFCTVTDQTVEHPDAPNCFGSKKAPLFPHMRIQGPGLVMLSPMYPDAKVVPISLDEFPNLWLRHDVFMAASDASLQIEPRRLKRGKEVVPKGEIFYSFMGRGVVFLNVTGGIVKYQVLKSQETLLMNCQSVVSFQGSCQVSLEKETDKSKTFRDLKITGPGLVIVQSLSSEGRHVERWGFALLGAQKVVPKPKGDEKNNMGHTPSRPLPEGNLGKASGYSRQALEKE